MKPTGAIEPQKYQVYLRKDIDRIPELQGLPQDMRTRMRAVSAVLPFRVNKYVVERLIDWDAVPDDPMFQLTFPQLGMLEEEDGRHMLDLVTSEASKERIEQAARQIQRKMNPHPAGQLDLNVPRLDGEPLPGMQHKYRETVLFFPSQGQTCHAYCTYCFRWAQFVGLEELKFANREAESLVRYLRGHPEVTSVLFTGGDPLVMKTKVLRRYVEPLLDLDTVASIRIGTKALSYWPYRVLTDPDADDLLRLFEEVRAAGKHLALMGHYSHPRELEPGEAREAVRRVLGTGAVVRTQAPLIRHVNDDAGVWRDMWRDQVRLGAVPYYMFVERDTGPKRYFEVPLVRSYRIFSEAYGCVSGLARTVRGPSMSATPGKVLVDGITHVGGRWVLVLKLIQGRDPSWVNRIFFAAYDEEATWLDDLRPAFGERDFFFNEELERLPHEGSRRRHAPRRARASGRVPSTGGW